VTAGGDTAARTPAGDATGPDGDVVIVGAGQAGCQVAMSLRQGGWTAGITVLGEEPDPPYQRPPLSKDFLTARLAEDQLALRPPAYFADHAITLRTGMAVARIDRAAQRVLLADGTALAYGHLVLATGARHRRLNVPGAAVDGVFSVRTLAEARALRPALAAASRLVVIGAGFIGLEIAAIAAAAGCRVDVLEAAERPLARAVSVPMSHRLAEAHRAAGVRFHLGTGVAGIERAAGALTVRTTQGAELPADVVLVGIGALPNTALAEAAGLAVANGIVVDAQLLTGDPAISAIGDCAAYPSRFAGGMVRLESVQNAVDQARCVAARLLGKPAPYGAVPWFWSNQGEMALQIAGLSGGHDTAVLRGDPGGPAVSVFCFGGGGLLAVESLNRPADHMAARRLLAAAKPLTPEQAGDAGFDLKAFAARA
jgi:3-phenylpropionate/trans-cinnamate dioxygenase ferredoxin reductase subunit